MKATLKLAFVLFTVCGLAAGALAFVNAATKDRIAAFALQEQVQARKAVFPQAEEFAETDAGRRWDALRGGQKAGLVLRTSIQGYSGPIGIMVGVDSSGVVTGARILSHSETPGLGAKIVADSFIGQFRGKSGKEVALRKDDTTGGRIDAIAAATISSRAVAKAIRTAVEAAAGGK